MHHRQKVPELKAAIHRLPLALSLGMGPRLNLQVSLPEYITSMQVFSNVVIVAAQAQISLKTLAGRAVSIACSLRCKHFVLMLLDFVSEYCIVWNFHGGLIFATFSTKKLIVNLRPVKVFLLLCARLCWLNLIGATVNSSLFTLSYRFAKN